jgi:hypothetical protein
MFAALIQPLAEFPPAEPREEVPGFLRSMILSIASLRSAARAACALTFLSAAGVALAQNPAPGTAPITAAPGTAPIAPRATAPLIAYTGPKYDNRWEVYGGLLYMNGQAGQDLQFRYNMGGGEVMGTYWLGSRAVKTWGVAADYRIGAGTSPVQQNVAQNPIYHFERVLVMQHIFTGGVVYRTPFRNRYIGIDAHALGGAAYGIFDHAIRNYPNQSALVVAACPAQTDATHPISLGLYCNHLAPYGTAGISMDFNESQRLAFRLQPDMVFEHFGTETREFFSISMGVMYRFGGTKK